jgi:hypothetical protein
MHDVHGILQQINLTGFLESPEHRPISPGAAPLMHAGFQPECHKIMTTAPRQLRNAALPCYAFLSLNVRPIHPIPSHPRNLGFRALGATRTNCNRRRFFLDRHDQFLVDILGMEPCLGSDRQ